MTTPNAKGSPTVLPLLQNTGLGLGIAVLKHEREHEFEHDGEHERWSSSQRQITTASVSRSGLGDCRGSSSATAKIIVRMLGG